VAPLLPLAPLLACYCLALVAALQSQGAVHGVKQIKALCAIFLHTSAWYRAQRRRGPWSFDWAPPMPQLVRELSSSVLAFKHLANPSLLPDEAAIAMARIKGQCDSAQQPLEYLHTNLDASLTVDNIRALAEMLAPRAKPGSAVF
jgi:hypothetical protein